MKNKKAVAVYLRLSKEDEISERELLKAQDRKSVV